MQLLCRPEIGSTETFRVMRRCLRFDAQNVLSLCAGAGPWIKAQQELPHLLPQGWRDALQQTSAVWKHVNILVRRFKPKDPPHPSEHQLSDPLWVLHSALRVQELLPLVQRWSSANVWSGSELHPLRGKTHSSLQMSVISLCIFLSYAGDEFEARLIVWLGRPSRVMSGVRAARGLWRSECHPEEVGHFGESSKSGCVGILDESLWNQSTTNIWYWEQQQQQGHQTFEKYKHLKSPAATLGLCSDQMWYDHWRCRHRHRHRHHLASWRVNHPASYRPSITLTVTITHFCFVPEKMLTLATFSLMLATKVNTWHRVTWTSANSGSPPTPRHTFSSLIVNLNNTVIIRIIQTANMLTPNVEFCCVSRETERFCHVTSSESDWETKTFQSVDTWNSNSLLPC